MRSPLAFFRRDTPEIPPVAAPELRPRERSRPTPVIGSAAVRATADADRTVLPAAGQMLDVIGTALAATGRYALEDGTTPLHEVRLVAERWRRHVSTGLGHPGDGGRARISRGPGLAERDWSGASRFVVERRRAEHEHVSRVLGDFRESIRALVQGLHAVLEAEEAAGQETLAAVDRVRAAIAEPDSAALRSAALAAVGALDGLLAGRARARGTQVAALGARYAMLDVRGGSAPALELADPLTGLGVGLALEQAVAHAAALRALWGHRVCLALVAVESLDTVAGAAAGDDVLLTAAAALARVFLRKGDALFRVDDVIFAVLLGSTGAADAIPLLERIPEYVESGVGAGSVPTVGAGRDGSGRYALTVGFAELRAEESAPAWVARAERALGVERARAAVAHAAAEFAPTSR